MVGFLPQCGSRRPGGTMPTRRDAFSQRCLHFRRDTVTLKTPLRLQNEPHTALVGGGVIGCKQFSWLRGVGCGLSSAFEYGGPCCDRCGAGVWVVPGAHRQNARPVPVGDQGRDQAQRGRRRVLQGRGGGAHGRTPTRPSQGARPRGRPCSAGPCRVRPRPGPNAPPDQRAPQGRSVWQGGHHGRLPSSRWAHDQPRGDLHMDPHAIPGEEPRRSTGSCCPHGVGRARGPPPAGASPRSWACG